MPDQFDPSAGDVTPPPNDGTSPEGHPVPANPPAVPYGQQPSAGPYGQQPSAGPYGQQPSAGPYGQQAPAQGYQQPAGPYSQQPPVYGQQAPAQGYQQPAYVQQPVYVQSPMMNVGPDKSVGVAYLFLIFLGVFGAHQFYLDKVGRGIGYLLTLGWLTVGLWIDLFTLASQVKAVNTQRRLGVR